MAPLTNAERQARFRQRLRERASLDALGARAREACERAVAALWGHYTRLGTADAEGCDGPDDYRAVIASAKGHALAKECRAILGGDDLTDEERAALQVVVDLDDALALRPPPE